MYDVYFDSGTTNTRMYVLDEKGAVVFKTEKAIGSKDAALADDNTLLARELNALFVGMLEQKKISQVDVSSIWMSGMISCPNGIVEVPHIGVPVGLRELAARVHVYEEKKYFKRKIHFIPGVKSVPDGTAIDISNVDAINNMRGEETEIMGIMSTGTGEKGMCIFIMPGSHTQIAITRDGRIVNIISTITGELYKALKTQTILSASLTDDGTDISESMVISGYENLIKYGFNRAIYIDRALLLFTKATALERHSYLEGVLNGGVLQAIRAVMNGAKADAFVCGNESQYAVINAIAQKFYPEFSVRRIESGAVPFSVLGYKAISKTAASAQP